ncbi:MAG TPA: STAS domain-containing protein [Isosphaeraceae bacterium]|nr:STAS domain-containing protein [Isosphaeraceae bacterium]
MGIRLVAETGLAQGQALEVRVPKFFIGSHEKCHLRPNIPGLAGVHALVEERDGMVYVRDFGGEEGTAVNDRVLHTREVEVFDGDRLKIGPLELLVAISKQREETSALAEAPPGWPFLDARAPAGTPVARKPAPQAKPAAPARPLVEDFNPSEIEAALQAPKPEPPRSRPSASGLPVGQHLTAESPNRDVSLEERPLDYEVRGDLLIVRLRAPDLNDEFTVGPLRTVLRNMLDRELPRRVVVDLSQVKYMSTRAVGVILAHFQALCKIGGSMRVCCASGKIQPVLKQMHLHVLIDIRACLEEALSEPWE